MLKELLFQISLFQAVALGEYDGGLMVSELKTHGDTGIGIFEAVNGELIMLDGVVYQALSDGTCVVAKDNDIVPYANVAFFESDVKKEGVEFESLPKLEAMLNEIVEENGKNQIYLVKVKGVCSDLLVRSELKQEKPYKMLNVALKSDERRFEYKNIFGTMVGLYCPSFMSSINAPGWHFHYVSDDGKIGGHLLSFSGFKGNIDLDKKSGLDLQIPDRKSFNDYDLSKDYSKQIKEAESGKY